MLPAIGSVLGVDIGYSLTRRSSAVCRLDWDTTQLSWAIQRFRASEPERTAAIVGVGGVSDLTAAAFDGPLRRGFDLIGVHRVAESVLTWRLQSKIGKPGQSSSPVGKNLNIHANICAKLVLGKCCVAPAPHEVRIDDRAIVEAFPTAFLGVMIVDPIRIAAKRKNRSDTFFLHLIADGTVQHLLHSLLPGRTLRNRLDELRNHDDRAGFICALTALCVAAGDFTAVGDTNGWIILPPRTFVQDWAWADLTANARNGIPEHLYSSSS